MKKRMIGAASIILMICLLVLAAYLYNVKQYKDQVKDMSVKELNLKSIPDGTYIGECDVDFIYAKVRVTISAGEISKIELLKHKNERGLPAESIINNMVEEQKIDVDAVSGATNSSKVIKKAVENALQNEAECSSIRMRY